jgi:hypothetical protein
MLIAKLMRVSVLALFLRFCDERQAASAAMYVARLDPQLIAHRSISVCEVGREIVVCGGVGPARAALHGFVRGARRR